MRRETFLCGDIGGTNTRFALYEVKVFNGTVSESEVPDLILSKKYHNEDFPSFLAVLNQFLYQDARIQAPPTTACLAVAGPVKDNTVRFTNRDSWSIDGDVISEELQIPVVRLVNDFLAVGYGILTLDEDKECITLQQGKKDTNAPIACIGAGTGLGECFLSPGTDGHYQCFPCEGGHAEFAPRNELEMEMLTYLKHKFEQRHRISVERIVSGSGLANIYEFLSYKFPEKVDSALHEKINAAGDFKGAVIATNIQNDLCKQTMEIFTTAYGAEAGVAALKWLPYGGLYLTGGLTPKNIDWIRSPNGPFMEAFLDKGRVSGMLCSIPVYAVMVENLGERGAEYLALKMLREEIKSNRSSKSQKVPDLSSNNVANPGSGYSTTLWVALAAALGVALGSALAKGK